MCHYNWLHNWDYPANATQWRGHPLLDRFFYNDSDDENANRQAAVTVFDVFSIY